VNRTVWCRLFSAESERWFRLVSIALVRIVLVRIVLVRIALV